MRPDPGLTVLVTGASSGIGRATAHLYAARGAQLVLASRSPGPLDEVRRECLERGALDVLVHPVDVGDAPACSALVDAAVQRYGHVDVAVHSAAVAAYGELETLPLDVLEAVVRTNVLGPLHVARPVLAQMREQDHGRLVLVGSLLGRVAVPHLGSYVVTKWAVRAIARVLELETRDARDVRVSLVSPGGVDTPIYRLAANYRDRVPRAPWPVDSPEKVARAVARAVERPTRERSVGPANGLVVAGSVLAPKVYDALVGPLMRLGGFTRTGAVNGPGNVLAPVPAGEGVRPDDR